MKPSILSRVQAVILPLFLIASWDFSVRFGIWPESLISGPVDVVAAFWVKSTSGELVGHIFVSLVRLILGFSIGFLLAISIGTLVGVMKVAEETIAPTLSFLAPVPPIAWIPILIVTFGIQDGSKIALIAIGVFFVVYTNVVTGIRSTDQKLIELAQLYRKSRSNLIRQILLPSALPNIFLGVRIALALSWILLIAAEVIASAKGLGWLIWDSRNFGRPDDMLVGMITVGLLGKLSDDLIIFFRNRFLKWRDDFSGTD